MSILKGEEDILSKSDDAYNSAFLGADLELDGSRRREISLYKNDEMVLSVEHGVTLELLKLIYSSDSNFKGVLQGVRSRPSSDQSPVSSVVLADDRVLDQDEYELIVQDIPAQSDILQQTISTQLPLQSSTIPLQPTNASAYVANGNSATKKMGQFVCEFCHLPFISKAKFLRHRRIHTEEKPYVCVYCNDTFSHHSELRKHRDENHMTNKSFKCNCCPKTFATRAELRGHLWRHTGEKNHKCRICGKKFATKGNLKLHIDKHIGVHKHKCPFCPQRFTSHSSLEAHMAKHTGMKAYKCRFCPKSYSQAGQLTSHERLHTGEKPFVCQVCGKGFRLNSTRLSHEKRHTGDRPHICDTCGRSFSLPEHLRRHGKTHENKLDRLVACPFCKKKIFAGRNMRKHLARHRELSITESQAKVISASLKPDRESNERDLIEDDHRSNMSGVGKAKTMIRCMECNEEIKSARKLIEHLSEEHYHRELTALERKEIRIRHGLQKLHNCQFCSSYFIDYRLLRSHVLVEHAEHAEAVGFVLKGASTRTFSATHKCPNCSLFFHLRSALDDHIIRDHLSTAIEIGQNCEALLQFRCWYCPKSFDNPEEVVTHMTTQHESLDMLSKRVTENTGEDEISSSGIWSCTHCPRTMKTEEDFKKHLSEHQDRSFTGIRSKQFEADEEVNSYLNPLAVTSQSTDIENGEPTTTDCVMTKYLKTDNTASQCSPDLQCPLNSVATQKLINSSTILTTSSDPPQSPQPVSHEFLKTGPETSKSFEQTRAADSISESNISFQITEVTTSCNTSTSHTSSVCLDSPSVINDTLTDKKKPKKSKKKKEKKKNKLRHLKPSYVGFTSSTMESCRFCSDVFKDKTELCNHMKTAHSHEDGGSIPFRCWFCSGTFSSPEEVVSHMTNEHDNLDNLSRRIEVTDLKNQLNDSSNFQLKLFKTSADASLSPDDSFRCSKCPKKLESKEAFELHLIVHEASTNDDRTPERSASSHMTEVTLTGDQIDMDHTSSSFTSISSNETFEFNKCALVSTIASSCVPTITVTTANVTIMDMTNASTYVNSKRPVNETETLFSGFASLTAKGSIEKDKSAKLSFLKKVKNYKRSVASKSKGEKRNPVDKKSLKKSSSSTIIVDGGLNLSVNLCIHCSRAFCGKKALDVHTLKMHGKEYLQKQPPPRSTSPFTCWFCSSHFATPELAVEHMTNAHENLDKLSKRVEDQEMPVLSVNNFFNTSPADKIISSKQTEISKVVQIAPQKQLMPLPPINVTGGNTQPVVEHAHQPPPGFKMSYALAYVPILIPDKSEEPKQD